MNSIKEIIEQPSVSAFTGSIATRECIRKQISLRWGEQEAEKYDPYTNCFTFLGWAKRGFKIRSNEQALRSITYREILDEKGKVKKIPRTVFLFYRLQVRGPRNTQP